MSGVIVVKSFANLGYLDPSLASLRCALEYEFVVPHLGRQEIQ